MYLLHYLLFLKLNIEAKSVLTYKLYCCCLVCLLNELYSLVAFEVPLAQQCYANRNLQAWVMTPWAAVYTAFNTLAILVYVVAWTAIQCKVRLCYCQKHLLCANHTYHCQTCSVCLQQRTSRKHILRSFEENVRYSVSSVRAYDVSLVVGTQYLIRRCCSKGINLLASCIRYNSILVRSVLRCLTMVEYERCPHSLSWLVGIFCTRFLLNQT